MDKETMASLLANIAEIEQSLIETDGVITPEVESRLDSTLRKAQNKVDACAFMRRYFKSRGEFWRKEARMATMAARSCENGDESLESYLKRQMIFYGLDSLNGITDKFTLGKPRQKVRIYDESRIPAKYTDEVVKYVPNHERILDALIRKEHVPGAALEEERTLRSSKAAKSAAPQDFTIEAVKFKEDVPKQLGESNEQGSGASQESSNDSSRGND